jgi:hypothetical protein
MPQNDRVPEVTVDVLIRLWDGYVQKLVDAGVGANLIAESLWAAGSRAESLHATGSALEKLDAAAERLENVTGETGGYSGPERRGPERPWSGPDFRR